MVRNLVIHMSHNFGDNSEDLWNEFGNPKTPWDRKVEILVNLAQLEAHQGHWTQEIKYLQNAVDLAIAHDLIELRDKYLNVLSVRAMNGAGNYPLAVETAEQLIGYYPGLLTEIRLMEEVGTAYTNKARALVELRRFADAHYAYRVALEFAELLKDLPETAASNLGIMRCLIELGEPETAKQFGLVAKNLYQDHRQLFFVCEVDRLFARIHILEGNYVKAKNLLKEVRVLEQYQWHMSHPETKLYLGMAYHYLGQLDRAQSLLEKVIDQNIKPWQTEFNWALLAADFLIETLNSQEKFQEAERIALTKKALAKRLPGAEVSDDEQIQEEIDGLSKVGKHDLAEIASRDWLHKINNEGDISKRWIAISKTIGALWNQKKFNEVVELWDQISHDALNYQDEVVIRIKNFVTHALQKVGRLEEALKINQEVLQDRRTALDSVQHVYAKENAARVLKDMKKTREANSFKEEAMRDYIQMGFNQRAISLMDYFKKKQ